MGIGRIFLSLDQWNNLYVVHQAYKSYWLDIEEEVLAVKDMLEAGATKLATMAAVTILLSQTIIQNQSEGPNLHVGKKTGMMTKKT